MYRVAYTSHRHCCTETGEKLKEAATLNCLHQATTCGCIASCSCLVLLLADRLSDPSKLETASKSHFTSHSSSSSFLQLHPPSISIIRPIPVSSVLFATSPPPCLLGLNTGPAAGLLSLSSSRRCAARRRRRRRRRRTSKHKQTREQQSVSQSVSQSAGSWYSCCIASIADE
ncbi:hypothetical protein GGI43DRAFT_226219 [Trichoderma evansii]